MGASAVKCWRSLRNREREARTGVAAGWGLPSTNRQNEMVAVIEIVRGAPSQAAFSRDGGEVGFVEQIVRHDREFRRPQQLAQRLA